MDPRTALKLTDKNRGLWTAQCSDAGKLLYNMLEVILLTVEKKSNIDPGYLQQIKNNIDIFFNVDNSKSSAIFGAFYRNMFNPELVLISAEDIELMTNIMQAMGFSRNESLTYVRGMRGQCKTAKDAHIAFLKQILFPGIDEKILAHVKVKYILEKQDKTQAKPHAKSKVYLVSDLLNASLDMIELLTTPLALLVAEEVMRDGGEDLKIVSAQNSIKTTLNQIRDINLGRKEVIADARIQMIDSLFVFKNDFFFYRHMVLAKKELQQQFAQEHQDLLTNYQKLAMLALSMAEGRQVTVHEVRLDQDYSPLIQAYVTRWVEAHGGLVKRNEKLQMEIDLLKALGEENAALKAENAALIAGMAAFEREHTGLNDLIHGEAPPPPPFPEALVVGHPPGLEQVVNVGPAALVVGAPEPWSALAMSKEHLQRADFLKGLDKEIKRVEGSKYGTAADRQDKIARLNTLLGMVGAAPITTPLTTVLVQFMDNADNRTVICHNRRTDGLFKPRDPNKATKSLELFQNFGYGK